MATVKLFGGMEKLDGWREVKKLLKQGMDKEGLEDCKAIIIPTPEKSPYGEKIEHYQEKTFLVSRLPVKLDKLLIKETVDRIILEFLSPPKKKGKDPHPNSMEE